MSIEKIPTFLLEGLKTFLNEAEKEISIDSVYIYGSHINGNPSLWSDLDVVVVSSSFDDMEKTERITFIRRIKVENNIQRVEIKASASKQWERGFGFMGKVKTIAIPFEEK